MLEKRKRARSIFRSVAVVLVFLIVIVIIAREIAVYTIQTEAPYRLTVTFGPGQTITLPNHSYVIKSGLFYDSVCFAQVTASYVCSQTMIPYETIIAILGLLLIASIVLWRKA